MAYDLTEQKALFASAFWGSLHYILSHFPQNKSICVPISVPDDVSAHACTCSTKVDDLLLDNSIKLPWSFDRKVVVKND